MKIARNPDHLRRMIRARWMSQRRFAVMVGCSPAHITNLVSGRAVSAQYARRAARLLGQPLDELFRDADPHVVDLAS